MKIIHENRNSSSPETGHDCLELARQFEKNGDTARAIAMYEKMIKNNFQKELGYQRLMILFRRLKDYRGELQVINKAIEDFKQLYSRRNNLPDKKVITTSKKLIKLLGLTNNLEQYPQPLPRWSKRKQLLTKRIVSGKKG